MDKKPYDDSNWREESIPYHTGKQVELLMDGPKSLAQSWMMQAMYGQWKKRNVTINWIQKKMRVSYNLV